MITNSALAGGTNMDKQSLRRWTTNLGLLLVVGLPVFAFLLDLTRSFRGDVESHSLMDRLGDLPLLYVGFFLPYVLGGMIYLACVGIVAKKWRGSQRWVALGLIPVMALGWIVFPLRSSLMEPSIVVALAVSAVIFASLVRLRAAPG